MGSGFITNPLNNPLVFLRGNGMELSLNGKMAGARLRAASSFSYELKGRPGECKTVIVSCTTPAGLTSRIRVEEHDWPAFLEMLENAKREMDARNAATLL
jgi:hypothetical protein